MRRLHTKMCLSNILSLSIIYFLIWCFLSAIKVFTLSHRCWVVGNILFCICTIVSGGTFKAGRKLYEKRTIAVLLSKFPVQRGCTKWLAFNSQLLLSFPLTPDPGDTNASARTRFRWNFFRHVLFSLPGSPFLCGHCYLWSGRADGPKRRVV